MSIYIHKVSQYWNRELPITWISSSSALSHQHSRAGDKCTLCRKLNPFFVGRLSAFICTIWRPCVVSTIRVQPNHLSILYTLAVSPSLGGSRQHKRNNKNNGGFTPFFQQWRGIQPSLDGTAGATQPILPRLPQLTSLHRCRLPYCPYHRAASTRQPRGNSRCQSELRHNHSPLIPIPSTLTCLPYIHPPINLTPFALYWTTPTHIQRPHN